MDLVVMTDRFPKAGETVFGGRFGMFPGGKGANQAVACAKLGGTVHFIGKMGDDIFHDRLVASMKQDGVRLGHLLVDTTGATGICSESSRWFSCSSKSRWKRSSEPRRSRKSMGRQWS